MRVVLRNTFVIGAVLVVMASAANHHELNGTWVLASDRSHFGGQSAIQNGSVTIWDRQHNITVSRTFDLEGAGGTVSYTLSMDGREGSSIHDGKAIKYKARWDGNVLVVTTTADKIQTVERYSMGPDGRLMLAVERPGHAPMTLVFRRQ